PAGKYQPINAFGRVWNNLTDLEGRKLNQELGWATARESGYTATSQLFGRTSHFHRYLSLPDNRVVDIYNGLLGINWTWAK
ncbi:MAG TPA: hypothetical protein VHO69_14580, partial [Phototrophicaceae bacterium]|nr:hypothetical protein [Phototrophicaceae bacterium]